jgi:hypothetical protein
MAPLMGDCAALATIADALLACGCLAFTIVVVALAWAGSR